MEINTTQIKSGIWQTLGILLIAFLALSVVDKLYAVSQNFKSSVPKNTISMTAEGKVSATPDLATITLGVTATSSTAKVASDDVNKKINTITDMVKNEGIDAKDITTSNYSVYPTQDYTSGTQRITGYIANETLTIKVHGVDKSADKVGKVLDGATSNGGNQIQGVYFSFDDADNLKQEARKQAIEKAKQKANDLASASGIKLGKIVSISESSVNYPYPMPYALDSVKAGMGGGGTAPEIQTGSQDITAQMTVVFEVK